MSLVDAFSVNRHLFLPTRTCTRFSAGITASSRTAVFTRTGTATATTSGCKDTSFSSSSSSSSLSSKQHLNNVHGSRKEFLSFIVTTSSMASTMVLNTSPVDAAASPTVVETASNTNTDSSSSSSSSSSKPATTTKFTSVQIQKFLQPIPTFAIVDPSGTPYMVVGEDAKLSAYFFTSYEEAQRILNLASQSSKKAIQEATMEENSRRKTRGEKALTKEEMEDVIGINPWVNARISSVPLDFASGLAFKGKLKGAYFRIAPSERDIQDAIELDNLEDLQEGKVPLFYVEDFEMRVKEGEELWSSEKQGGGEQGTKIPLYFSKGQLLQDWKKANPSKKKTEDLPEIKVTELFSLLTEMVTGQGSKDELAKLVLVPPSGSEAKARACLKRGGKESPYKLGERIVVL